MWFDSWAMRKWQRKITRKYVVSTQLLTAEERERGISSMLTRMEDTLAKRIHASAKDSNCLLVGDGAIIVNGLSFIRAKDAPTRV